MMANGWPMSPLSEIATPISRPVAVVPGQSYRTIGVKWWGEGAYERETIDGSRTAAKTLSLVRKDDLIINKIWVRHGSTAIALEAVDGCAGSGEFPTFELDRKRILPRWIHWLTKTQWFWTQCDSLSRGTSGKNRIRPELFLTIQIPLPPLDEQRPIVARIEELAAKTEEARGLRRQAVEETEALAKASLAKVFAGESDAKKVPLREVSAFQRGRFSHRPRNEPRFYGGNYPFIQINDIPKDRKFITTHSQSLNEAGLGISKMFSAGTLVVSIAATIGAVGILGFDSCMPDSLVGIIADETKTTADYLYYFMRYEQSHLEELAPASAQKNINIRILNEVKLPTPSLEEQRRMVAYLDELQAKVDAVKRLQAETSVELEALLPSVLDRAFKGEL